jgi:hypothetical protein
MVLQPRISVMPLASFQSSNLTQVQENGANEDLLESQSSLLLLSLELGSGQLWWSYIPLASTQLCGQSHLRPPNMIAI